MKIPEDVQTGPIEINSQSAGATGEDQIFLTTDETEEQHCERKAEIRRILPTQSLQ